MRNPWLLLPSCVHVHAVLRKVSSERDIGAEGWRFPRRQTCSPSIFYRSCSCLRDCVESLNQHVGPNRTEPSEKPSIQGTGGKRDIDPTCPAVSQIDSIARVQHRFFFYIQFLFSGLLPYFPESKENQVHFGWDDPKTKTETDIASSWIDFSQSPLSRNKNNAKPLGEKCSLRFKYFKRES